MRKAAPLLMLAALLVTGCAGPKLVEFGGVRAPFEPPVDTVQCDGRDWDQVSGGAFVFPGELIAFWRATGNRSDARELEFSFDILPTGETRNIVFEHPARYAGHGAVRHAIKNAADTIEARRYAWRGEGPAPYAVDCGAVFDISLRRMR